MSKIYFNLMKFDKGFNYRWVQPPQIAYLVSTIDENGNNNTTPVTLGTCVGVNSLANPGESNYYFAFSVGSVDVPDIPARQAFHNLERTPECVISYPESNLMEQIWIAGLPLPAGIDEIEVAQLTPLASKFVKPAGIYECPINMEARVKSSCSVGDHYKLYICQILSVSVNENLVEEDEENPLHYGVLATDPLFEVAIVSKKNLPPRLYFGKIDRQNLIRTPDDIGSSKKWIDTFEEWITDEFERGKINQQQKDRIFKLHWQWQKKS
jgi:flavin reductase (DIM6/NTAB) family NADH-FMN oxidoreductase RutF